MARKTEVVAIGATQYTITQLGAVEGRRLYKKFVTAIGPLLREAISELQNALKEKRDLELVFGALLMKGIEVLPLELFEELCVAFSVSSTIKHAMATGAAPIDVPLSTGDLFDSHFAGEYMQLTAWLGHCIRVNGFLAKLPPMDAAGGQPAAA